MTLEQFADLMQGLGYKAEKGEREKVKAAPEAPAEAAADATSETPAETPAEAPVEAAADAPAETADDAAPEQEVFFTFTWGGNRGNQQRRGGGKPRRDGQDNARGGDRPPGKGKPKGKGGPKGGGDRGAKSFSSRPPKKEKAIDPDNPFAAALMGLKDKS
jgi:ATP-dependent RNA helicase SUPV3L1/SUV3